VFLSLLVWDFYIKVYKLFKTRDYMDYKNSQRPEYDPCSETSHPPTRIVKQPTEEEIRPTANEQRLLQNLLDWQERSAKANHFLPG